MNEVDDTGVPAPLPASDEIQDNIRDDIHERISQEDVDEESEALGETQEEEEECLEVEESCEGEEEEKVYGGCEGPDAMYVKLISSDGHVFVVKKKLATISGTVKAMLSGPGQFKENETNEVNFREIPSHVLQKVCLYFAYKTRYTNSPTEIPEFPIAPELALELLMAANFLDC